MRFTPRARGRACLLATALTGLLAPAGALGAVSIVYGEADAANAILDGTPEVQGLSTLIRQAPVGDDARWTPSRLMGKVTGRELAAMPTAEAIATALRENASIVTAMGRRLPVQAGVGVDEITPQQWTVEAANRLRDALAMLPEELREKVIFYGSPALVTQVGRADPREPLAPHLAALVEALGGGGHLFLEIYGGDLAPFEAQDLGEYLTRWLQRFPAERQDHLHVLTGPPKGATVGSIWNRVRATEAGRTILKNGAGAFGLKTADEGREWLIASNGFTAAPDAPSPDGEVVVPVGGGVAILHRAGVRLTTGGMVRVRLSRPGTAIVRLWPVGKGPKRNLRKVTVGHGATTVAARIPRYVKPGKYKIVVSIQGQGLTDMVATRVKLVRGPR
jgi:hypothetical protein